MKRVKALFEVPTCYHIRDKLASLLNPEALYSLKQILKCISYKFWENGLFGMAFHRD